MAFDQRKGATYRILRTVKSEKFSALLFELGEPRESISPRRNTNRVHQISVLEISNGEVC